MSEASFSVQALAAFEREKKRKPTSAKDMFWLQGYDACRSDNASALNLMQQELDAWRDGRKKL